MSARNGTISLCVSIASSYEKENNYYMEDELNSWKWIHQKLTDQIDREFELMGQRMNWLLAGNAFLYTVVAISIGVNKNSAIGDIAPILIYGASTLGIIVCLACYFSMKSARKVIFLMKEKREIYEGKIKERLDFDFNITVPTNAGHFVGNVPYYILPFSILTVWIAVVYKAYVVSYLSSIV